MRRARPRRLVAGHAGGQRAPGLDGVARHHADVVRETVVRRGDGPGTFGFVAIGGGVAAALLGTGYLGAHLASRGARMRSS